MSIFKHPGFALIPVYKARGWLRKALRRPAKAAGVLPVWMGTKEEAIELLAKTPAGPDRTALKTSVFALMYGAGPDKIAATIDPEVAKAALSQWEHLKAMRRVYPLPKLDDEDARDFRGRPTTGWGVPKSCETGHHGAECPVGPDWPCMCSCHHGYSNG